MKKFYILLSTLLFAGLLIASSDAFAQTSGLNITVSPTVLELSSAPDQQTTGRFRLRNNSSENLNLSIKVDKLNANLQGQVLPANPRAEDSYISWLSFDKTNFTALPREWTDINYSLKIPNDAAFGYYYAIRISQVGKQDKSNTTILGEIVIPLLLDVKNGGAVKKIKLVDFKVNAVSEYLPIAFTTTVENAGNTHLKPRGNIFIRNSSGKDVGLLEVNEGLGSVLPGSKREFTSNWIDGFLVKDESGKIKINWNKLTEFRIGKYTANLLLVYDNGTRDIALEKSLSFWVIPYTAIGIMIATLIVIFLVSRFFLRIYIKNQISKIKSQK